ncbi:DUF3151 family protein [Corynebacterium sp. ES2794-CONJ1]|uniref:DUF3151 family protein n=1 Tax=unclassified Corynebacterium TaxID=2624378 RepID=UPI002169357E|nr:MULTISPECIES: DUF3151 family protein [unclassified Corynebacterium]MCS4489513.1 DUF3151 family protein [Corynebacterium sp. ES2775-CONJ]MCS4491476.1 DUF3151 family protein [Corynebacterium sp. ES2715-CONJ3]MCS4531423.1 DUF3151 family protein [Corynebacterium sp. ES2730-CONJ]MCU9518811.1 DUF3151 family protein [Corynebacterium sp. ES2794-CONJ1]
MHQRRSRKLPRLATCPDLLAEDEIELPALWPIELPADNIRHPIDIYSVIECPDSPLGWAELAENALDDALSRNPMRAHHRITAYTYACAAYVASLNRLTEHGWKGTGHIPFSHLPNQGVLRAVACLARASELIGDSDGYERYLRFLLESDPACVSTLIPKPSREEFLRTKRRHRPRRRRPSFKDQD